MAEQSHFAQGASELAQLVAENRTSDVHNRLLLDSQYMSPGDFKSFVSMAAQKSLEHLNQDPNAPTLSALTGTDHVVGISMNYPGQRWGNLTRGLGDNHATVYDTNGTFIQGLTAGFMDSSGITAIKHALFGDQGPKTQYLEFGPIELKKEK